MSLWLNLLIWGLFWALDKLGDCKTVFVDSKFAILVASLVLRWCYRRQMHQVLVYVAASVKLVIFHNDLLWDFNFTFGLNLVEILGQVRWLILRIGSTDRRVSVLLVKVAFINSWSCVLVRVVRAQPICWPLFLTLIHTCDLLVDHCSFPIFVGCFICGLVRGGYPTDHRAFYGCILDDASQLHAIVRSVKAWYGCQIILVAGDTFLTPSYVS